MDATTGLILGSYLAWLIVILYISIGTYLLFLVIKALRIYIKKNS